MYAHLKNWANFNPGAVDFLCCLPLHCATLFFSFYSKGDCLDSVLLVRPTIGAKQRSPISANRCTPLLAHNGARLAQACHAVEMPNSLSGGQKFIPFSVFDYPRRNYWSASSSPPLPDGLDWTTTHLFYVLYPTIPEDVISLHEAAPPPSQQTLKLPPHRSRAVPAM